MFVEDEAFAALPLPIGSFHNPDNPRRIDLTNLLGMELVHRADGTINGVAVEQVETALASNGTRLIVINQVLQPPEQ